MVLYFEGKPSNENFLISVENDKVRTRRNLKPVET